MAKGFRPVRRDQPMLLPQDMREWLPKNHLVWFVLDTVELLDTSGLERATSRRGGVGAAGFDPRMLLALVIYAYCQGVRSSRQMERLCVTDVAFRVLCAQDGPDHATIARFRVRAGGVFTDLFAQVLMIAAKAGLAAFGTVAIDGTKIEANASIDANRAGTGSSGMPPTRSPRRSGSTRSRIAPPPGTASRRRIGFRRIWQMVLVGVPESPARPGNCEKQSNVTHAPTVSATPARLTGWSAPDAVSRSPAGSRPGRITLSEARAHLTREIVIHQAKLDRYEHLIGARRKPMGRPPVPIEESTRVNQARRVVANAETVAAGVAAETMTNNGWEAAEDRGEHDRFRLPDHAHPTRLRSGL